MDKNQSISTHYDADSDILYVWWKKPQEVVCVEPDEEIILRLDANTDQLVGYTLIGFCRRFGKLGPTGQLVLPLVPESAIPEEIYKLLEPSGVTVQVVWEGEAPVLVRESDRALTSVRREPHPPRHGLYLDLSSF